MGLQAQKKRVEVYKSHNISRTASDLKDPAKFGVADAQEFARLLRSLNKEIADLKELRVGYTKAIRELESAMLKGWFLSLFECSKILKQQSSNNPKGGSCTLQQGEGRFGICQDAQSEVSGAGAARNTDSASKGRAGGCSLPLCRDKLTLM